jgi:L-cystine transport system permease protein
MEMFKTKLFFSCFPRLLARLPITLMIVTVAFVCGFLLALLIAAARLYRVPVLSWVAVAYTSFVRGIPILVLLFIVYVGLPLLLARAGLDINHWDTLVFVLIAYTLSEAAFLSEIIRSAITAVDPRQVEAARSVGLTSWQAFRRIVAPQAVQIALPSLGNVLVSLLKDTSLAYSLGVIDVIGIITSIRIRTNRSLEAYTAAAILFLTLSFLMELLFQHLNRRMGAGKGAQGRQCWTGLMLRGRRAI